MWLAEDSLLVLKGGSTIDRSGWDDPWQPLDNFQAPYRSTASHICIIITVKMTVIIVMITVKMTVIIVIIIVKIIVIVVIITVKIIVIIMIFTARSPLSS